MKTYNALPSACLLLVATADAFLNTRTTIIGVSNCYDSMRSPTQCFGTSNSLGFLSFDLDDTLFPTGRVVDESNALMVSHMQDLGFMTTVPDFLSTTRVIRKQLDKPVTYTELRKMAIRGDMERTSADSKTISDKLVNETFDVWLDARQRLANEYLFDGAVSMLENMKREHPNVCIAAITNGRGDPSTMPQLAPFFDFCVSGEDDDVFPNRKPQAGIYEVALERYQKEFRKTNDKEDKEVWCHVGDCLANDVGASADCGAYAVWYCPDEAEEASAASRVTGNKPNWSTATAADLDERAAMADKARAKVAARIQQLPELVTTLDEFLKSNRVREEIQVAQ